MIRMEDVLRLIEERRDDAIAVPSMTGGRGWREVSKDESLDLPVSGAMGKTSSVALGLCLSRPDKKVIVIDSDGALAMNLGTLVTIGGQAPENLYHFLLDNEVYAVTGGQPTPNAGNVNYAGLARAAGYAASFEFDDLEDLVTRIDEVMDSKGPVFASIKTVPEIQNSAVPRQRGRARRTAEAIEDVSQALSR